MDVVLMEVLDVNKVGFFSFIKIVIIIAYPRLLDHGYE